MTGLVIWMNRFFKRPGVGGRESKEAYSLWERRIGRRLVAEYLEPWGDIEGKRILDVGCGLGGKTVAYGEGGAVEVFGLDISEENLAASEEFASGSGRGFSWGFLAGDASNIPLPSSSVDTVVANDAMEHFAYPIGALAEMKRVVKPGGAIWIFFTPHFSPLGSHLYDYIYIPWCHLLLGRRLIEKTIRRILEKRSPGIEEKRLEARLAEIMRSYDEDINHMSIRRFFRLVKMSRLSVTFKKLEPPKYGFLGLLTRVPGLRELFTGTVTCRLEKTDRE